MEVSANPIDVYFVLSSQFPALFKRFKAKVNSDGMLPMLGEKYGVASAATSKIERPAGNRKAIGELGNDLARLGGSRLLTITVVP